MKIFLLLLPLGLGLPALARAPAAPARPASPAAPARPASPAAAPRAQQLGLVDEFHPDHQPGPDGQRPPLPPPTEGGSLIVHLEERPAHLCYPLLNKAVVKWLMVDCNESLGRLDGRTLEWRPNLATHWTVEDTLVLRAGAEARYPQALRLAGGARPLFALAGKIERRGQDYHIEPAAAPASLPAALDVPAAEVESWQRGTVYTLALRSDARWQDGHLFDSADVVWSAGLYTLPELDASGIRYQYLKLGSVEALGAHAVRFAFREQYFGAEDVVLDLFLVPRHLFDLGDPDCAKGRELAAAHEPGWTPDARTRAEFVRNNPCNQRWVGLGPYRITSFQPEDIRAERWDGYFDAARAGHFDAIRWRYFPDAACPQAVLANELDFYCRMKAEDYFGEFAHAPDFTREHYAGAYYVNTFGVVLWNLRLPKLADARVRRALALACDFERFRQSNYQGLARQVTGTMSTLGPAYDASLAPYPHDPEAARALLAEAGWLDRDGDGWLDRAGEKLAIEFLYPTGNKASEAFAAQLQSDYQRVGVQLTSATADAGAMTERVKTGRFESVNWAWVPPLEMDPEQLFHSRWTQPGMQGSNHGGFADAECDRLIEAGQITLDAPQRYAIWHQLQRRLYELQPMLFMFSPPRKFALRRDIRGFEPLRVEPCYSLREWYYAPGSAGTRARAAEPATAAPANERGARDP